MCWRKARILVDLTELGKTPRVLFFLEQNIRDARAYKSGERRIISRDIH